MEVGVTPAHTPLTPRWYPCAAAKETEEVTTCLRHRGTLAVSQLLSLYVYADSWLTSGSTIVLLILKQGLVKHTIKLGKHELTRLGDQIPIYQVEQPEDPLDWFFHYCYFDYQRKFHYVWAPSPHNNISLYHGCSLFHTDNCPVIKYNTYSWILVI